MSITGLVDLDLQIGCLRKTFTFAIFCDLAVPMIVDTAYQDKLIEVIQCKSRRLEPFQSRSVAILDTFDALVFSIESEEDAQPKRVQMCRRAVAAPMSEEPVLVRSEAAGVRLIQQHTGTVYEWSTLCANGLMEVVPGQPFKILVSDLTNRLQELPKPGPIAWADPAPDHHISVDIPWSANVPVETISITKNDELQLSKRCSACIETHVAW